MILIQNTKNGFIIEIIQRWMDFLMRNCLQYSVQKLIFLYQLAKILLFLFSSIHIYNYECNKCSLIQIIKRPRPFSDTTLTVLFVDLPYFRTLNINAYLILSIQIYPYWYIFIIYLRVKK